MIFLSLVFLRKKKECLLHVFEWTVQGSYRVRWSVTVVCQSLKAKLQKYIDNNRYVDHNSNKYHGLYWMIWRRGQVLLGSGASSSW